MYSIETLKEFVDNLHSYGIKAAIDNFGIGSSSMDMLRKVEFDVLKIDRTFVDNSTEKQQKILKHIVGIAKDTGAQVIEEWVKFTVVLLYFAIGLLIISQTNKIYYSFDSQNRYQRERFYIVAYLIPLAAMCILVFLTVRNIKKMEKKVAFSLIFFEIFPVFMSILQFFIYGTSLTNISVGFSAIVLFAMAVIEQNYMLNKVSATEMRTGLPNSYGYFRWISILRKKDSITKYNSYYFTLKDFDYYNRKYSSEIVLELQKNIMSCLVV